MAVKVQFRRGTATEWTTANPVLSQGEAGYEHDTGRFKIGNGVSGWNSLPYSSGVTGPTGPSSTATVGSVSTLSPGASATVVNSGTASAAVYNLWYSSRCNRCYRTNRTNRGNRAKWWYHPFSYITCWRNLHRQRCKQPCYFFHPRPSLCNKRKRSRSPILDSNIRLSV